MLTDNMDTVFERCHFFALSWTVCLCVNVYMNLHVYLYIRTAYVSNINVYLQVSMVCL